MDNLGTKSKDDQGNRRLLRIKFRLILYFCNYFCNYLCNFPRVFISTGSERKFDFMKIS